MKLSIKHITTLVSSLTRVIQEEKGDLEKRITDRLEQFTEEKKSLLSEFDRLAQTIHDEDLPQALMEQLDILRQQAEENARQLNALMTGAKNARSRITEINQKLSQTGLYERGGKILTDPASNKIARNA